MTRTHGWSLAWRRGSRRRGGRSRRTGSCGRTPMRRLLVRKVKAELTQPVQKPDGSAIYQPGAQFDEVDKALADLPRGHVRYVIVETDEPTTEPEVKRGPGRPRKIEENL